MTQLKKREFFMIKFTPSEKFLYNNTDFLNYEVSGKGDIPLILIHGFGASLRNWDCIRKNLDEGVFTIYSFDCKGAGFSSKPVNDPESPDGKASYSIESNADIILEFIEEKGLEDFFMAGHSMGGGITLFTCLKLLEKNLPLPQGIILIDSACYVTKLPFFVKPLTIPIINKFNYMIPAKLKVGFALRKLFFNKDRITPEIAATYSFFWSQPGFNRAIIETAKQIVPANCDDLIAQYPLITCPALIIWGRNDEALKLELAERLNRELPNSELKVIDNCRHNSIEEYPEDIAGMMMDFLSGIDSA
jgi:pimeloyl-ACP methyl ester carboxylesterase